MTEAQVREKFDLAWPSLKRALIVGDTHRKEHVWQRIKDGRAQLWTDGDTAAVTTIEKYDTGLTEVSIWLCGGDLSQAQSIHERIEAWARSLNINRINITGREGWLKSLQGYRKLATIMTKEL